MTEFKKGDLVQLKSGGPKMTVDSISISPLGGGGFRCIWFSGSKLQTGVFDGESLIRAKADDGGTTKGKPRK